MQQGGNYSCSSGAGQLAVGDIKMAAKRSWRPGGQSGLPGASKLHLIFFYEMALSGYLSISTFNLPCVS